LKIYFLIKKNKIARVKDIAEILNVKLSSVTGALRQLKEKGYIKYSPYSFISLTEKGDKVATTLINAHKVLKELFMEIFLIEESKIIKSDFISKNFKFLSPKDGIDEKYLNNYGVGDISLRDSQDLVNYLKKRLDSAQTVRPKAFEITTIDDMFEIFDDEVPNKQ